jgi:hypothetical protein
MPDALLMPPLSSLPDPLTHPGAPPPGIRLVVGMWPDVASDEVVAFPVAGVHVSEPDEGGDRRVLFRPDFSAFAVPSGTEAGVESGGTAEGGSPTATVAESPENVQKAHVALARLLATGVEPDVTWLARAEEALREHPSDGVQALGRPGSSAPAVSDLSPPAVPTARSSAPVRMLFPTAPPVDTNGNQVCKHFPALC